MKQLLQAGTCRLSTLIYQVYNGYQSRVHTHVTHLKYGQIQCTLDYLHLNYSNILDYPNRETMTSVGDLNYFTYPNFNYTNPQGVQIIEVALYYTCKQSINQLIIPDDQYCVHRCHIHVLYLDSNLLFKHEGTVLKGCGLSSLVEPDPPSTMLLCASCSVVEGGSDSVRVPDALKVSKPELEVIYQD